MVQRNKFIGIIVLGLIFLILLALSKRDERFKVKLEPEFYDEFFPNASLFSIRDVLKLEQAAISRSLEDYEFPPGKSLDDYLIGAGGAPVRSVIVTTWRSGSTFLGAVMNAVPGNFYHYEPLLDYGIIQIRGPPYSEGALTNLRNLLNCDYSAMANYLEYGKLHTYLFTHNTRLWGLCEAFPQYCWNSTFLSQICRIYPFQSMKTVRLRLKLVDQLLRDPRLNIKVLLLVRDPRGTLQSRRHRDWCPGEPDCDKPNLLCADMVSDYSAAIQLKKQYPDRFRAIRYEDLSLDPYTQIRSIFQFFGLFFHSSVADFLDSHTKHDIGGVSSTFRDSKTAPFRWKMELNYSDVQYIEENCDEAMKLWGYNRAMNDTHLREFHPLADYVIN